MLYDLEERARQGEFLKPLSQEEVLEYQGMLKDQGTIEADKWDLEKRRRFIELQTRAKAHKNKEK